MGEIEWAMWANEQAIVSAIIIFIGGIIGVIKTSTFYFNFWECAAASIPISLFVYLVEYPRGKRLKGRTIERKYQSVVALVLDHLKPVSSNYFVRFIMYIILSVPCCFLLPTLVGGMSLQISALIYLLAAVKGEQWIAVAAPKKDAGIALTISQPPVRPPPRTPNSEVSATPPDDIDMYNRF